MIVNDHTRKILSVYLSGQGLLVAGLDKAFYQPPGNMPCRGVN